MIFQDMINHKNDNSFQADLTDITDLRNSQIYFLRYYFLSIFMRTRGRPLN